MLRYASTCVSRAGSTSGTSGNGAAACAWARAAGNAVSSRIATVRANGRPRPASRRQAAGELREPCLVAVRGLLLDHALGGSAVEHGGGGAVGGLGGGGRGGRAGGLEGGGRAGGGRGC